MVESIGGPTLQASKPSCADPIEVLTAAQRSDPTSESVHARCSRRSGRSTSCMAITGKYFGTLYAKHARLQVLP
jgi:hypothetical protein